MTKKSKILREEIAQLCQGLGIPEPHEQLVYYSAGIDPTKAPSILAGLIQRCHERREDGRPRAEDWEALIDWWQAHPEYHGGIVDQDIRVSSATNLMPYMHPKLKSVEVSGELEHLVRVVPLTDEEIERVKDRLKNEY